MLVTALALLVIAPASAAIPAGATTSAPATLSANVRSSSPQALAASAAVPASPSKLHQIKVLDAVLKYMREHFAMSRGFTQGPMDIFVYQIGNLWKQGIDGAGTTVAVIEGWDDPNIVKFVAGYDKLFGLPNPQIQTIFPAGSLPSKCPPG